MVLKKDKEIAKGLQLLIKSSYIVFIGLVLSKIFTYFYRILIARSLGPELYGLFSLASMILLWFIALASFGLPDGLVRYVSWYRGKNNPNKVKHLFHFSIKYLLISSIIFGGLLFFLSEFISLRIFNNPSLVIFLQIFSFLVPIYIFANAFLSILQAFEEIGWYSFILNILENFVKVLFIIIFIIIGLKSNAIIFSYFLGILSMVIIAYFVLRHKISFIFDKDNLIQKEKKDLNKRLLSYSWPIMFIGVAVNLFYWTDSFFIGYFIDVQAVGFYNAAVPLALLMKFSTDLFISLFLPLITKKFSKNKIDVIKELSKQVGKWILIINIPLFIMIYFFPGVFINMFFGSEYLIASPALKILSIGALILSIVPILSNLLSMAGKSKLILANFIASTIINLLLNILLIPKYGLNGAALATTISSIFLTLIFFIEVYLIFSFVPLRRKILKIFLISLIPTAIILFISSRFILTPLAIVLFGIFYLLIYSLLILLSGALDKNDYNILKEIKKKITHKEYI